MGAALFLTVEGVAPLLHPVDCQTPLPRPMSARRLVSAAINL